jgi:hypothetical protein
MEEKFWQIDKDRSKLAGNWGGSPLFQSKVHKIPDNFAQIQTDTEKYAAFGWHALLTDN